MSTLADIEAAADALRPEEKEQLIRFLSSRLNGEGQAKDQTNLAGFSGTLQLSQDPLAWQKRVRGEWA
jgi:hypothetical protein